MEFDAAVVVYLDGCRQIEIAQRNLLPMGVKHVYGLTHNRVVSHFLVMPVAEYQDRRIDRLEVTLVFGFADDGGRRNIILVFKGIVPGRRRIDDDMRRLVRRRS